MTKEIVTEILIDAEPGIIWRILTDFDEYPKWNPFIKSIKGNVNTGNKIVVRMEPPGAKGMTFKPKVLVMDAGKEIRWLGHLLFAGLFDGEHKFELIKIGDKKTLFRQSEIFKGLLVPLLSKQLDSNTRMGFEAMNKKLKEVSEKYK
jgi:hypothetical protein